MKIEVKVYLFLFPVEIEDESTDGKMPLTNHMQSCALYSVCACLIFKTYKNLCSGI